MIYTVAAAYYGHGYCGQPVIVDKSRGTVFSPNKIRRLIWTAAAYCGQAAFLGRQTWRHFISFSLVPSPSVSCVVGADAQLIKKGHRTSFDFVFSLRRKESDGRIYSIQENRRNDFEFWQKKFWKCDCLSFWKLRKNSSPKNLSAFVFSLKREELDARKLDSNSFFVLRVSGRGLLGHFG